MSKQIPQQQRQIGVVLGFHMGIGDRQLETLNTNEWRTSSDVHCAFLKVFEGGNSVKKSPNLRETEYLSIYLYTFVQIYYIFIYLIGVLRLFHSKYGGKIFPISRAPVSRILPTCNVQCCKNCIDAFLLISILPLSTADINKHLL